MCTIPMIFLRPEREDQSDDFRRQGDLSGRARRHGQLPELPSQAEFFFRPTRGALCDLSRSSPTPSTRGVGVHDSTGCKIDLRLYLMCIYKLVLVKQLAEAW